ncbi:MAG: prepilin-type N-terminal cleavage/methylation domain-containing protein [Xanthomonadales bacterium]|nr:prepilin-type N-terminal cleavage/methylation domain-containing protein [Xanthomonadales bacterium]
MATHASARSRGFTLIEIMVVVAIISGLAGIILFYLTGEAKKASAEMAVLKMAEEMSQLSRAVDDYYTSARIAAISADNTAQTVTVSTLITEGLLPSTFANRQGAGGVAVGTSPFGQPYAIRAIRRPGSILTFVVFDSGTVMPGPITRTGYNTTTDSLTTLKGQVSSEISKHYQIPTGIIRQGETTARGGFSGFTINVSAYVGASGVTQPTAIVLKGFPELESDGGDGGDEPTGGYSGTCNIVWGYYRVIAANTYQYYSPSCPSNAEEVDRFSACTTGVRVRNTPVGLALTIAPNHSETQTTRTCNYGNEDSYTDVHHELRIGLRQCGGNQQ